MVCVLAYLQLSAVYLAGLAFPHAPAIERCCCPGPLIKCRGIPASLFPLPAPSLLPPACTHYCDEFQCSRVCVCACVCVQATPVTILEHMYLEMQILTSIHVCAQAGCKLTQASWGQSIFTWQCRADCPHMCVCAGRWEARIGIPASKHIYLGLFNLEKEAAQAYDRALVRLRGTAAATNFALSDYRIDLAEYHKMQQVLIQNP